jgi:hypothetical protein
MIALRAGRAERYVHWIGAHLILPDGRALLAVLPRRYHVVDLEGEWFAW